MTEQVDPDSPSAVENTAASSQDRTLEPEHFPSRRNTFDMRVVVLTLLAAAIGLAAGVGRNRFAQADRPHNQLVFLWSTVSEFCLAGGQPTRPVRVESSRSSAAWWWV